jgi:hypothetical protein
MRSRKISSDCFQACCMGAIPQNYQQVLTSKNLV